uniref:SH3 domain-containing protein n=1 Tax=Hippocampus comes TaxID=109280 RepID=A0A3Q3DTP6_HIPCM
MVALRDTCLWDFGSFDSVVFQMKTSLETVLLMFLFSTTQPPPSYDQVIQEKTREEHIAPPTAAPRRFSPCITTTCSTQTDPVREKSPGNTNGCCTGDPQKPPRPSLLRPEGSSESGPHNATTLSVPTLEPRPVPLPRIKSRKQTEANIQTLVKLEDDELPTDAVNISSNEYLKELLDVFSPNGDRANPEKQVDDEMNSQRNIQSRIQAFESQLAPEHGSASEPIRPQPLPRKPAKPPVSAKPPLPSRSVLVQDSQYVSSQDQTAVFKPQPPQKLAGNPMREELETLLTKGGPPQRSRPAVLTRDYSIHDEAPVLPPRMPVKPPKEPLKPNLNINNHNSAAMPRNEENAHIPPSESNFGFELERNWTFNIHPTSLFFFFLRGPRCVARFDFEGASGEELSFMEGDVIRLQAYVGDEWARGQLGAASGIFPLNFVEVVEDLPSTPTWPQGMTNPNRVPCMTRFDFEGDSGEELSFMEGDVIRLQAYVGDEWARGQLGAASGIFPLNFVEVVEDLPSTPTCPSGQNVQRNSSVEWAVAQHDFDANAEDELSFKRGDCILVTRHVDAEWSCGRLNGKEGIFPKVFVESRTAGEMKGRAMYEFISDCDEELSLQVGDIITNLESINDEWFLGDLRGKRALVPKNYVQVL